MSIILQDLVKRYGEQAVVDRVSLEIQEGELFVLLGASGSGKSTILRMIAGLIDVDDGRVILHGRDVTDWPPQERNIGLVFQNYSLFPHMTVAENVEFGLAVRKVPRAERAAKRDELLALVGLAGFSGRNVRRLSGGQQQRVAVARALAFAPSVLLLDEPFGALDVKIRAQLRRALRRIQDQLGVTAILVTHDQEEAFELGDRIGVIERGRLLEVGPPIDLYRRPRHQFVAGFIGEANLLGVRREEGRLRLGSLRLDVPDDRSSTRPAVGWAVMLRPEDLALAPPNGEPMAAELGVGRVEEIVPLGATQRVRVRLDPLPGAWPIGPDFGPSGIGLHVALPAPSEGACSIEVGQAVRVGLREYHLLPRLTLRILLCVEGTEELPLLVGLGRRLAAELRAVVSMLCVARDESAAQRLEAAVQEAVAADAAAPEVKVRFGPATREILRETRRGAHDLVVVTGRRGLGRTDHESIIVPEEVVRMAPISVIVANTEGAVRRILLCTAAGEAGKQDVALGAQLARAAGAEATLLYVDDRPIARSEPEPTVQPDWIVRHLGQATEVVKAHGVPVSVRVRAGKVVDEILKEGEEGEYDLIVVGGHVSGTWPDRRDRDLAVDLVHRASRNVMVVKEPSTGGSTS